MLRYFVRITILIAIVLGFGILTNVGIVYIKRHPQLMTRHGLSLAYWGTALSTLSVLYMLRKHRLVRFGKIRIWLNLHVIIGSMGLYFVILHTRYNFNAIIPGYALWGMIIIGISGLFGWHVYLTNAKTLIADVAALEERDEIILSTMTSSAFRFWHDLHFIFSLAVLVLSTAHIASIFIYRGNY